MKSIILYCALIAAIFSPAFSLIAQTPTADYNFVQWGKNQFPTIQLTGNNGQSNFVFLIDSFPTNGTLVTNAPYNTPTTGRFRFQPYLNTNWYRFATPADLDRPLVAFQVVSGSATSQIASVSFSITNIPSTPFAHNQTVRIPTNQAVAITLTGDDDGNSPFFATATNQNWHFSPWTLLPTNAYFTILSQPTNGTLTGTAPNVNYQPNLNVGGTDHFTFKVTDGTNGLDSNIATVQVQIASVAIPEGGTVPLHTNIPFTFSRIRPGFTNLVFSGNGRRDDDAQNFVFGSANADRYNQPVCFNWYGTIYTNFWVNNNGMISFGLSNSVPFAASPFPISPTIGPVIAPFWDDVDTTGLTRGGVVTWGTGYVNGRRAIGFTWNDVGCYYQNTAKLNRFQVVLIDRSDLNLGAFAMEFNYDYLEWVTGSAYPTEYPAVGFDAGDGIHYVNTPSSRTANITNYLINGAPAGRITYLISTTGPPAFASAALVTATNATSATIFSLVNLNGSFGAQELHWGTTTNYGFTNVIPGSYYNFVPVVGYTFQIPVSPATTYQFDLVATNEVGSVVSTNYTFTAPAPPTIISNGPPAAGPSAAVNPNGITTGVWFQWGPDLTYGLQTPTQIIGAGSNAVSVVVPVSFHGGTYQYQAIATNSNGTTYGSNGTFNLPYNLNLLALQVPGYTFNEGAFDSTGQTTNYTLNISSSPGSITLSATQQDTVVTHLTYQVNGGGYTASAGPLSMNPGTNIVNVRVNANDNSTNKTYNLTVIRGAISNPRLAAIALDNGTLSPAFDPLTTSYSAAVSNSVGSVLVTATAQYSTALVQFNSGPFAPGTNTATIPLSFGHNSFSITSQSEDGTSSLAYIVDVYRALNTNGVLSSLTLSNVTVSPAFSPDVLSYSANVSSSVSNATFIAATTNAYASVQVNDSSYAPGTNVWPVAIAFGADVIPVRVMAQDGTVKTYNVTITRPVNPPHFDSIIVLTNRQVQLQLSGDPGIYWLDYASNLTTWLPLMSVTNTGANFEFIDPDTNQPFRFYRARSP